MAKKIEIKKSNHKKGLGTGFISWGRLEKRLRQAGELRKKEAVVKFMVTEDGINYTTRTKGTDQ